MRAVMKKNTDKSYPCVNCGSDNANIIREGADPKLKCNDCSMVYMSSDSSKAVDAGAIPNGPPKIEEQSKESVDRRIKPGESISDHTLPYPPPQESIRIPRTINYVFVSKDRKKFEFIAAKDLKKVALRWESEGKNYELFELQPKRSSVKIDIE